ncbi:MAG TPA: SMP-30/gluconolactonase/LRE family protein [Burkholderiaceae bacterium]|nr:SMP-30/gluconolactonase/LRE family protein [Burkholderiaceae bacterium]
MNAPRCIWPAEAQLGEGTLWSVREQALYWVDILGHRLHRCRADGSARTSWAFDEEISAVVERTGGPGLVVTLRHTFAAFDPARPDTPRTLYRPSEEPAGNRFNDGKCDARGRFWGGTMDFDCVAPSGALYAYDASGRCMRHELGFAVTNGPAWSLDQRTLFDNDTVNGCVYAWDFDLASGALSNRRVWLRFGAGDGLPDGMTLDAQGRLWIAHWGGSCVTCHDVTSAVELQRIALPVSQVTNVAFGGADLRTLFISSARTGLSDQQLEKEPLAGALFAMNLPTPGLPACLFSG